LATSKKNVLSKYGDFRISFLKMWPLTTLVHSKRKSFVAVATKTKDFFFWGGNFAPKINTDDDPMLLLRYFCLQRKWPWSLEDVAKSSYKLDWKYKILIIILFLWLYTENQIYKSDSSYLFSLSLLAIEILQNHFILEILISRGGGGFFPKKKSFAKTNFN